MMSLVSVRRRAISEEINSLSFVVFFNQIRFRKYALDEIAISWREQQDKSDFERNKFSFFSSFFFNQSQFWKYALDEIAISPTI